MLRAVIRQLFTRRDVEPSVDGILAEAEKLLYRAALDEAYAAVARALAFDPHNSKAFRLRGRVSFEKRRFAQAEADYQAALALEPDAPETLLDTARLMYETDRFDESLALTDRAVRVQPDNAHAHYCRGLMLRELGKYAEAEGAMREAQAADPASLEALCGLALVLVDRGRHLDAESTLREVLSVEPGHVVARWQLAMLLLLQGRFAEGWRYYAARWLLYDTIRPRALPFWDGKNKPDGYLLVLAEQGLGDEILFASCFNDLIEKIGEVIIECDLRLCSLYARSFPRALILGRDVQSATPAPVTPTPAAQIAAGSLCGLYRPAPESFPQRPGFLVADESKIRRWRECLAALAPGPKVGLSWRGGTAHTRRALRSVPPDRFASLLQRPDITFISLQYNDSADERAAIAATSGRVLHHWPEALADYDETAALIAAMDLVITVQTAAAHLTGALGRPVWIILPASPEWRYLAAGDRLTWYPSAELFRQRHVGNWDEVIEAVTRALDELFPRPVSRAT